MEKRIFDFEKEEETRPKAGRDFYI